MFTPKRMGLFGSARLGNGIMPGDQQSVDLGDFTGMANRGSTAAGEMMQGVGAPRPISTQPVDVMQGPELKPKGGGFFGSDGIGTTILGSIGDYLMQVNGLQPTFAPSQMLRRQQELIQQRAEQQRKYDLEDYVSKLKLKQQYDPSPGPQPYRTEDNVGNVWEIGPDGNAKPIFIDKTPKYYIQGDQALQIPNPYATQGAPQNRPKIGETVRLDQLGGPSISNTPAPQTGDNGFPATLTRDQYQAVVNEMGQAETDAWMARNNVRLGN